MSEYNDSALGEKETGYVRTVRSLRELIDLVTGRDFQADLPHEDAGLADVMPFPFLALVGQQEMKLSLLLSIINPLVSGVLLVGPRGTGKTTTARSLVELLPSVERSNCFYGCLPEDILSGGMDAVCPDCARKFGEGLPLTTSDRVRLIELPLHASIEDVVGWLDDKAEAHKRVRLQRGILANADLNVLYVDEVNLLNDDIVNAILDAAASGVYTVRRGAISASYRARFNLVGSMNPEEGNLRPQIMDRFGLRVIVRGLEDPTERVEAYQRSRAYRVNPRAAVAQFQPETLLARDEIQAARTLLGRVEIPASITKAGTTIIQEMRIDSLRAEITLFEAARALAAADARAQVSLDDLRLVAPMALRLRRSEFMVDYFEHRRKEEDELHKLIQKM
ncbi:MAG: ATP-binding protein [Anaerolineaceae bacterium]|nr:ATP-binding protein [Anaerolineaceae bacterium]